MAVPGSLSNIEGELLRGVRVRLKPRSDRRLDVLIVPASAARNLERRPITNVEREIDRVHLRLFTLAEAQDGLILAR